MKIYGTCCKGLNITGDIKETILQNHPDVYNTINKILSVKIETDDRTMDQMLLILWKRKIKLVC